MRNATFVRKVDIRKKGMKAVTTEVHPFVSAEAKLELKRVLSAGGRGAGGQGVGMDTWPRQRPYEGARGGGYMGGRQQWGGSWNQGGGAQSSTTGGNWQWRRDGRGPVDCFNCGMLGHVARDCPYGAGKGGGRGLGRGGGKPAEQGQGNGDGTVPPGTER